METGMPDELQLIYREPLKVPEPPGKVDWPVNEKKEAPPVLYEKHASMIESLNAGLEAFYEKHHVPEKMQQRIEVWFKAGSEMQQLDGEAFWQAVEGKLKAIYRGGISMGVKTLGFDQTEHEMDVTLSEHSRVAVGEEWMTPAERITRLMGKEEHTMPADFLSQAGMEVIFTFIPREGKGLQSSLRSDMLTQMFLMQELRKRGLIEGLLHQEQGADTGETTTKTPPELWLWSNSGFKHIQVEIAAKAKLEEGVRRARKAGKIGDQPNLDEVRKAFAWLREHRLSWEDENEIAIFSDSLEAFEYLELMANMDVYMGGAPYKVEDLTFPFSGADEELFRRLWKQMVQHKVQQKGIGKLVGWEKTSPLVQGILDGKPLPMAWQRGVDALARKMGLDPQEGQAAVLLQMMEEGIEGDVSLLISRLIEMGQARAVTKSDLMPKGLIGEITHRLFTTLHGQGITTAEVDTEHQDVVDTTRGAASIFKWLYGLERSLVVVTDPEVKSSFRGEVQQASMGHGELKNAVRELRSWVALQRLQELGEGVFFRDTYLEEGMFQVICRHMPAVGTYPGEDKYGGQAYKYWVVNKEAVERMVMKMDAMRARVNVEGEQVLKTDEERKRFDLMQRAAWIFESGRAKFIQVEVNPINLTEDSMVAGAASLWAVWQEWLRGYMRVGGDRGKFDAGVIKTEHALS